MADAGRGAAVDRVTRTMSLALGVGGAVFGLLALGGFLGQLGQFQPWWSWGVAIGTFIPLFLMAVLSRVAPVRALRVLGAVSAVSHLGGLVLLVPALVDGTLDGQFGTPWLLGVSTVGTAAAAVAWRPAIAWPYLVACVVALGVDRWLASDGSLGDIPFQDAVFTLLFDTVFTALALATYRAGRVLDATADVAIAETRHSAAAGARARERTRVEALLHDSVLVALLASARGSDRAARQAQDALGELDAVVASPGDAPLAGTAWLWRLQSLTTDLAPEARFSHDDLSTASIPPDAAQAVLEATAEAVRNSVLHAGPASRAVHARVEGDEVEVTVLDDGEGFDPDAVRPGRLGLSVSILERMRALPGGRATIVSLPGVGTRVSIGWRRAA